MPSHSLYHPTQLSCGHLYGFGYSGDPAVGARLARLMARADVLLDIRYRPVSRTLPAWNRTALEKVYGTRYAWGRALAHAACTLGLDSDFVLEAVEHRMAAFRSPHQEDVEKIGKAGQ